MDRNLQFELLVNNVHTIIKPRYYLAIFNESSPSSNYSAPLAMKDQRITLIIYKLDFGQKSNPLPIRFHQDCHAHQSSRQVILANFVITSCLDVTILAIIVFRRVIASLGGFRVFDRFMTAVKGCEITFCRLAKVVYLCRRNGKAVYRH